MINSDGAAADYSILLVTRCLRAFGFGFAGVLIGIHLERRGLTGVQIGLTLTISLLASSLSGVLFAAISGRAGRRWSLALTGLLMAASGLDLALAGPVWLLAAAGITGMLGAASVDYGPFLVVEQAMLAQSADAARRNRAFARYSTVGGLAAAAGALASGLGAPAAFFLLYGALGAVTAALPLLLSQAVEAGPRAPTPLRSDLRPLAGLIALFAVDSLGGGFVTNAVVAYWLHARFGAGPGVLGPAFAGIAVVQAVSYEVSGRLADRFGLINTMVFTHLPSNLLLLLVPLSPTLPWAVAVLLVRFALSQMDVPARQAYIVSIVPPPRREAALASTSALRGVAQAAGPLLAGAAIQASAYGLPFFLGGALKIVYDLALFAAYRSRRAEHESRR